MKVTKVSWRRTVSKNFQSVTAEVEIEIDPNETASQGMAVAKALVDKELGEGPSPAEVERAKTLIERDEQIRKALQGK